MQAGMTIGRIVVPRGNSVLMVKDVVVQVVVHVVPVAGLILIPGLLKDKLVILIIQVIKVRNGNVMEHSNSLMIRLIQVVVDKLVLMMLLIVKMVAIFVSIVDIGMVVNVFMTLLI